MRAIVFSQIVCLTKFQAYFMSPAMCFSVSPLRLPMKSCSSLLQHFSWVTFESSLQLKHASSLILLLPKVTPLPFAIITSGHQACAFFVSIQQSTYVTKGRTVFTKKCVKPICRRFRGLVLQFKSCLLWSTLLWCDMAKGKSVCS